MNPGQGMALWRDPYAPRDSALRRTLRFVLVAGAHVALIAGFVGMAVNPAVREATRELVVRLIEPPAPLPETKQAVPRPMKQETVRRSAPTPPVMTAAAEASSTPTFAVAPQSPMPPRVENAPPAPLPTTGARFDAEYLNNPKPVYPVFSRRQGEEGQVRLRVRIGADGAALEVEIKQSSGFPRLDAAAREAVLKWRFVPARRGNEAIESWIGVPIVFTLEH